MNRIGNRCDVDPSFLRPCREHNKIFGEEIGGAESRLRCVIVDVARG